MRLVYRVAVDYAQWLRQDEIVRLTRLLNDIRPDKRVVKRGRAAIQNWRLRSAHVDHEIVQLQRCGRRQHVLHGVNRRLAFTQLSPAFGRCHFFDARFDLRSPGKIGPPENNSGPRRRRAESKIALPAQMQANPLDGDCRFNRATSHAGSLSRSSRSSRLNIPVSLNNVAVARSDSRCGRAGYPDHDSPAGTSPKTPA